MLRKLPVRVDEATPPLRGFKKFAQRRQINAANAERPASLLGGSRSTLYAYVPQLTAIRANAKAQPPIQAVPIQRAPITRESEPWWQQADFHLRYDSFTVSWRLTHGYYPTGGDEPILVEGYPSHRIGYTATKSPPGKPPPRSKTSSDWP